MKAQSVIVQFIIFFVLSLSILGAIATFFRFQADILKDDIASGYRSLVNSYVASASINLFTSCKNCSGSIYFKIPDTTAGYYTEIFFSDNQSKVISQPGGKMFVSSLHNLNYTLLFDGYAHSTMLINLTLEKGKNILGISSCT
jgi:hypothetical protein